jgi:hypothetical protein
MSAATGKWAAGIVWLHGLGDSGAGWKFIEGELGSRLTQKLGGNVKWLFPTAPTAPVSCNGGYPSTSWMDLEAIPVRPGCKDAKDDIKASLLLVHAQVAALEAEGIPTSKIAIGVDRYVDDVSSLHHLAAVARVRLSEPARTDPIGHPVPIVIVACAGVGIFSGRCYVPGFDTCIPEKARGWSRALGMGPDARRVGDADPR